MHYVHDPLGCLPHCIWEVGQNVAKYPDFYLLVAFIGLFVKGQGPISSSLETFPIYTNKPNLKGLRQIVFELERAEENLYGGGVTGLNLCLGIQLSPIHQL